MTRNSDAGASDRSSKPGGGGKLETIAAVTMGVLAVGCFVAQAAMVGATTTKLETALFNILQFLLTGGFSWFTSRAVSRADFEASLKRFAISAYRRISDVEHIVKQLNSEVRTVIRNRPDDADMRVVGAVVRDCTQIVRSSISDWSDVIGDELLALEAVRRLQKERDALEAERTEGGAQHSRGLRAELETRILELQQALPAGLRLAASDGDRPEDDLFAATWLARKYHSEEGLELSVVTGDQYDHDRDRKTLEEGEVLIVHRTAEGSLDVCDGSGLTLGRLQNCTPLPYDKFAGAFLRCFGDRAVSLKYLRDDGEDTRDGMLFAWFLVKVLSGPVIDTNFSKNLEDARGEVRAPRRPA